MRTRFVSWWHSLRSTYWFVPSVMTFCAAILAVALLELDGRLQSTGANRIDWLYTGGADGAREVLGAIAASMIGVAGTTFSITIAALTLASSQFGPRLLRNFMRDTGNQVVLGTFIGTFFYCLLVLRRVRSVEESEFVPHIAVAVSMLFAVASIIVLLYFIHHAAASIQASNVIAAVSRELDEAITRLFPAQLGSGGTTDSVPSVALSLPPRFAEEATVIVAPGSGYIRTLDNDGLLEVAHKCDLLLRLERRPGDFVIEGRPLVSAWPGHKVDDDMRGRIGRAFILGLERTEEQDAGFPIDQLVEIAVRALSPGINDPFTAITCVDRLGQSLCKLAQRATPSPLRRDADGTPRVLAEPISFDGQLNAACNQIRQYGRTSVAVTIRLLDMLADVGACASTEMRREAILRQAVMIADVDPAGIPAEPDQRDVQEAFGRVAQSLTLARANDSAGEGR